MKTQVLTIAAALGLAATTGYSQGTISFQNTAATTVKTDSTSIGGSLAATAATGTSGVKIQLLYQVDSVGSTAPVGVTSLSLADLGNWEMAGAAGNIGPVAGRFGAFGVSTGNDVSPAGNVWLQAIAWSGNFTTFADAVAGGASFFGYSTVWSQGTGDGASVPAVSTTSGFTGLTLTPVPEPTTIALGGLGAAALLLFRRKK